MNQAASPWRSDSLAGRPAAWASLVGALVQAGTLRTPRIIEAFRNTPRSAFVPGNLADAAVSLDAPLPIGEGQTVSQPTTVATMLELVQPHPGDRVLDVGTGSGWQAALLAHCVGALGKVVTIERRPQIARLAAAALDRQGVRNLVALVGDAARGVPEHAPYAVIISAASSAGVPSVWIEELSPGGRLLHPIAGMGLRVLRKGRAGETTTTDVPGYVFVPLVSDELGSG